MSLKKQAARTQAKLDRAWMEMDRDLYRLQQAAVSWGAADAKSPEARALAICVAEIYHRRSERDTT